MGCEDLEVLIFLNFTIYFGINLAPLIDSEIFLMFETFLDLCSTGE